MPGKNHFLQTKTGYCANHQLEAQTRRQNTAENSCIHKSVQAQHKPCTASPQPAAIRVLLAVVSCTQVQLRHFLGLQHTHELLPNLAVSRRAKKMTSTYSSSTRQVSHASVRCTAFVLGEAFKPHRPRLYMLGMTPHSLAPSTDSFALGAPASFRQLQPFSKHSAACLDVHLLMRDSPLCTSFCMHTPTRLQDCSPVCHRATSSPANKAKLNHSHISFSLTSNQQHCCLSASVARTVLCMQ